MSGKRSNLRSGAGKAEAALDYARRGWPVIPGAVWDRGTFIDPATGTPVDEVMLRPPDSATTNPSVVRRWWSAPERSIPAVLAVTGPTLGVVSVRAPLAAAVMGLPRFADQPTPVVEVPGLPYRYFLIRPPCPRQPAHGNVQVFDNGVTLPLPPTAIANLAATWLVPPRRTENTLMPGQVLAELLTDAEGA